MLPMIKAAAICMQKNEGRLIQSWILHHSNLFGAENLYVFDNVSEDDHTKLVLSWASDCGVNVIYGVKDFETKGVQVRNKINSLRHQYDWFFPLDADEFLGIYRNGKFSLKRELLFSELEMMRDDKIIRMSNYIWSIPLSPMGYYTEARKVVIPKSVDVALDIGFHLFSWDRDSYGNTVSDDFFQPSNIAYAHMHNKPYDKLIKSARAKLSGRVNSFERRDLEKYSGAGRHLVQYFMMNEEQYNSRFPKGEIHLSKCFLDAGLVAPFSVGY